MTIEPEDLGYLPDAGRVEALAGYGLSAAEIARVFDLEEKELGGRYARELASGAIKANARVAENLYRKATGEGRQSVTAAIFWLKTRARWSEHSVHHVVSERQARIEAMSDEELETALATLTSQISALGGKPG